MSPRAGSVRVLLVDDHAATRSLLAAALAEQGADVVGEAGCVKEGVAEALRLRPEVVLMDLRLPDGSGVEACRLIHTAAPSVRVIMLTLYDSPRNRRLSQEAGAHAFVMKTSDMAELYHTVALAVGA